VLSSSLFISFCVVFCRVAPFFFSSSPPQVSVHTLCLSWSTALFNSIVSPPQALAPKINDSFFFVPLPGLGRRGEFGGVHGFCRVPPLPGSSSSSPRGNPGIALLVNYGLLSKPTVLRLMAFFRPFIVTRRAATIAPRQASKIST